MELDFHGDLQVNLAWFFAVFSGESARVVQGRMG